MSTSGITIRTTVFAVASTFAHPPLVIATVGTAREYPHMALAPFFALTLFGVVSSPSRVSCKFSHDVLMLPIQVAKSQRLPVGIPALAAVPSSPEIEREAFGIVRCAD